MADPSRHLGTDHLACASCGAPHHFDPGTKRDPFHHTWPVRCDACGTEVLAPPAAAAAAVAPRFAAAARPKRLYHGRGFAQAFRFAIEGPNDPAVRLHHGFRGADSPHAWVEVGAVAFDPEWQRFYDRDDYFRALGIVPVLAYTPEEAAYRFVAELTPGPWPEFFG
ncbi:MAG TPA: hypothetical protein VH482_06665 [Thermomicrobiales bacterium]|jgi:hypothetical protein